MVTAEIDLPERTAALKLPFPPVSTVRLDWSQAVFAVDDGALIAVAARQIAIDRERGNSPADDLHFDRVHLNVLGQCLKRSRS